MKLFGRNKIGRGQIPDQGSCPLSTPLTEDRHRHACGPVQPSVPWNNTSLMAFLLPGPRLIKYVKMNKPLNNELLKCQCHLPNPESFWSAMIIIVVQSNRSRPSVTRTQRPMLEPKPQLQAPTAPNFRRERVMLCISSGLRILF